MKVLTYLGRFRMIKGDDLKVEERFLIMEQGYTVGKLLDRTESEILLDTGASKSFMSKSHYLCCKSLTGCQAGSQVKKIGK